MFMKTAGFARAVTLLVLGSVAGPAAAAEYRIRDLRLFSSSGVFAP